MSKLTDLLKTKSATVKKAAPPVRTKGTATIAHLVGSAPNIVSGRNDSAGGVNILKAAAYCAGQLDASDPDVKESVEMSRKIASIYGSHYPFSNRPNTLLVPASMGYLPDTTPNGAEINGAKLLRKEIQQRLMTVKSLDPDEAAYNAQHGQGEVSGMARKALNTLSDLAGGSTVPPPTLGDLIDLQRNLEVFSRAGANNVTLPPNGRMQFPKLTGGSTAYWVGEQASVTDSQQTTGSLSLEVKKLAVRVPFTNELMRFSDTSIDGMVRMDMAAQAALKADEAQLQGTGGTQIKGLITYPTASAWSQGVDNLLAYTVTANVFQPQDVGGMISVLPDEVEPNAWIMRRNMWNVVRNRRADAVTAGDQRGQFMFNFMRTVQEGGLSQAEALDGTKVVWSSQVSNTRGSGAQTYILLGYFPDWLVGRLGVLEFMVDPYTQMQNYQTVIQAVQFIDAGPRHTASFVFADAITIA